MEIHVLSAHRCVGPVLQGPVGAVATACIADRWTQQKTFAHKPEVGAAKPHGVLCMDLTKKYVSCNIGCFSTGPDQEQPIQKGRICTGQGVIQTKIISFPFLRISFAAVHGYPLGTNHCTLLLKALRSCPAQHCMREMFYCCFPCLSGKKARNRNNDHLIAHTLSLCSVTAVSEFSIYGSWVFSWFSG